MTEFEARSFVIRGQEFSQFSDEITVNCALMA
jgi:hypothetical protein